MAFSRQMNDGFRLEAGERIVDGRAVADIRHLGPDSWDGVRWLRENSDWQHM